MILEILKFPDLRLKTVCENVTDFGAEFQKTIEDMFETMYLAPGVGLAAIQVGIFKNFLVMDVGIPEGEIIKPDPKVLVNPKIVHQEGEIEWEEGCLSCPDLLIPTKRSQTIVVESLDRHGQPQTLTAQDLMAVCIQHEIDHLKGVLIVDRLSRLKRDLYKKQLLKNLAGDEKVPQEVKRPSKRPIVR